MHSVRAALLVFDFVLLACPLVYLAFSHPDSRIGFYYVLGSAVVVIATIYFLWFSEPRDEEER
jgi:F0F1-type ATP synthase assembly protein I